MSNLEACLKSWSNQKILKTLTYLDDAYYNGESLVSDQTYDKMIDYYKEVRKQEYKKIGAPIKGEKVKLPIHMGSMDKVKPGSSDLKNFFVKYTNPKCIMDKLELWIFTFIDMIEDVIPYLITGWLSIILYQLITRGV